MYSKDIFELAEAVVKTAALLRVKIGVAESCTGGMLGGVITSVPGSSVVFEYGLITYSNNAKIDLLGVSREVIEKYGAVSEEVVKEMAIGVMDKSRVDISISITGISGPGGGSEDKPVGLVWSAINFRGEIQVFKNIFSGDRNSVREQTIKFCLENLKTLLLSF